MFLPKQNYQSAFRLAYMNLMVLWGVTLHEKIMGGVTAWSLKVRDDISIAADLAAKEMVEAQHLNPLWDEVRQQRRVS